MNLGKRLARTRETSKDRAMVAGLVAAAILAGTIMEATSVEAVVAEISVEAEAETLAVVEVEILVAGVGISKLERAGNRTQT
jgi:TRAP-type C4-dicarboxylate transport system permease large subunit